MALAGHFRVALVSLFQNESSCKTCHVKNEFNLHDKHRGKRQLKNGLFRTVD